MGIFSTSSPFDAEVGKYLDIAYSRLDYLFQSLQGPVITYLL